MQAANDTARGLPLAPFMRNLHVPREQARLQVGFLGKCVLPLWRALADALGGLDEPIANLEDNLESYEIESEAA